MTTTPSASRPNWDQALLAEKVSSRFLERVPQEFARGWLVISQGINAPSGAEDVVIGRECSEYAIRNLGHLLGAEISSFRGEEEAIARLLDQLYQGHDANSDSSEELDAEEDLESLLHEAERDVLTTRGKSRNVKLVDALLFEALGRGASDIHIQPLSDRTLVRYRVDGTLHTARELSTLATSAVVSRIKVMGSMDIAEHRKAQDGRCTIVLGPRSVDLRISTFPTNYGERCVLRVLDTSTQLFELGSLGMPKASFEDYVSASRRSHGLVLITGPTGSGKTTTLYATLKEIASAAVNIMTVEDPIEYDLTSVGLTVSQSQVMEAKGQTFASGLRHILRQDPDIILVGEIRDAETARMAVQSSLTGHLVFSTLHTNDAASAISRLLDLGIEPFLVSASVVGVLAQRLVRTIHQECAGAGCDVCFGSGLKGRQGIYEFMPMSAEIQDQISGGGSTQDIQRVAREAGMQTLRAEGERLAKLGQTTLVEVERVVQGIG